MRKLLILLGGIAIVLIAATAALLDTRESKQNSIAEAMILPAISSDLAGYTRAIEPYTWHFPEDYGSHPAFQTEWWYYTGNLETESGQHFGYQFTIFRRATTPTPPDSDSEWRTNQVYMAHFTVTDVNAQAFYQAQTVSRSGANLAGATTVPRYRVWLDDWQVRALNDNATRTRITANNEDVSIDLDLEQIKPPTLEGDNGLSAKSLTPGNATYYYSLSRLLTSGTITIGKAQYAVSGASWMDHEFGTGAMSDKTQGWDWFGLHLDGNRELMVGQIRLIDGAASPVLYGGTFIAPDGNSQILQPGDVSISVTNTWVSPHTGVHYPAGWEIIVKLEDTKPLHLTLEPLVPDQELIEGAIIYWEGAVQITGDATGYGYAELTGYRDVMRGRF